MNAILLIAALMSNPSDEADRILRCSADRKGRFIVTQRQWDFIRAHLAKDKIAVLLHPKHGVNTRAVMGPKDIHKNWWSRQEILHSLTPAELKRVAESGALINPFAPLNAIYNNSKEYEVLKVDYRTWEVVKAGPPVYDSEKYDLELRRKVGPFHYIRLMRADRRLWLGEVSYWAPWE